MQNSHQAVSYKLPCIAIFKIVFGDLEEHCSSFSALCLFLLLVLSYYESYSEFENWKTKALANLKSSLVLNILHMNGPYRILKGVPMALFLFLIKC